MAVDRGTKLNVWPKDKDAFKNPQSLNQPLEKYNSGLSDIFFLLFGNLSPSISGPAKHPT
jgi:hypothetical protein